jgi:hypothetical protein
VIKLLARTGLLLAVVTVGGCAGPAGSDPPAAPPAGAASSTLAAPASTADPATSGWQVFTSADGGYRLRYPPGWRAKESSGSGGPVLSLLPPRGAGISLLVTSTAPPEPGGPGADCRPVRVGGLAGSRCRDGAAKVVTTTLVGRGRWFVLTTSLRRPAAPAGAYDRVLASFRPA